MIKVSKQAVAVVAAQRPEGYSQQLAELATREDADHYYFRLEVYAQLYQRYRGQPYAPKHAQRIEREAERLPRLVKWLGRFRQPADRGLGDTLERMMAKAGGRTFKHLMALLRLPCGCEDRRRWLNERFPFNQNSPMT